MGIPSQREATHDVDSNTVRLEQRREKPVQKFEEVSPAIGPGRLHAAGNPCASSAVSA